MDEVFAFFASEKNLEKITPPWLNFKVTAMSTPNIQAGTLIDYRLKIHGFPVGWKSLIEEWVPGNYFTDTQVKGPYAVWHHTHRFEKMDEFTTRMVDEVNYSLPMGQIGAVVAGAFVAKDIKTIFAYRNKIIGETFGVIDG